MILIWTFDRTHIKHMDRSQCNMRKQSRYENHEQNQASLSYFVVARGKSSFQAFLSYFFISFIEKGLSSSGVTNFPMKRAYHNHMVLSPRFTSLFFHKAITSAYGVHFEGIVFSDCVKFREVFCWSSYFDIFLLF